MRLVCELILIIGLIALGWQKSFKQWTDDWRGMRQTKAMSVRQPEALAHVSGMLRIQVAIISRRE